MGIRRTISILTDSPSATPAEERERAAAESDVIITAAAIGFSASLVQQGRLVRFDLNPRDQHDQKERAKLDDAVRRLDAGAAEALRAKGLVSAGSVRSGVSPDWQSGSVIMGVYELAGVDRPPDDNSQPSDLTPRGRELWERIRRGQVPQYTGVGAYTGFVDNHNTEGDTDPVGPYEIAVGEQTTKLASCFACSMFMVSTGYPPTSMHLGRGESWVPLYRPHHCAAEMLRTESAVVRDLNAAWYRSCDTYLRDGLLGMSAVEPSHKQAFSDLAAYLDGAAFTTAATVILDALTIHEQDAVRVNRKLAAAS